MPERTRKEAPITAGKDDAAKLKVLQLKDVDIIRGKKVTYTIPAQKEGRKVVIPASTRVEELLTVELADGSTLTVDANSPEHVEKIEQVAAKVESDIMRGKRTRKTASV